MINGSGQDILTCNIDWGKAWREHLSRSGLEANLARRGITQEEFWARYEDWEEILRRNGYPGRLLERVRNRVRPGDSILDIGAGAGAYALPLAKVARLVTAIEPSAKQALRLRENATKAKVHNLVVVEKKWEDVSLSAIGRHDIVLAAYCFQMADILAALEKMCLAARRYLVLIHTAGHDLAETLRHLLGVQPGPDYIYLYNALYQMGYRGDIEILTRSYRIPLEIQLDMFRYNPGLDEKQCQQLRDYLERNGRISFRKGEPWIERQYKDAMIWVKSNNNVSRKEDK